MQRGFVQPVVMQSFLGAFYLSATCLAGCGLTRNLGGVDLGLGPGGECFPHAVVYGDRVSTLSDDTRATWHAQSVEHRVGFLDLFPHGFRYFLTRSGLIDSVHTFAQSDIGDYFVVFLSLLALFSIGLIVWRMWDGSLKSDRGLDYIASREGIFLLNNWVLLGCVGIVMWGTLGEKISSFLWQETKYTPTWFNSYMVPSGLVLLILMGIGPLIPWRSNRQEYTKELHRTDDSFNHRDRGGRVYGCVSPSGPSPEYLLSNWGCGDMAIDSRE